MTNVLDFNNALTGRELETYLGIEKGQPADGERVSSIRDGLSREATAFVASMFPAAIISRKEARIGNIHGDPGGSLVIELQGSKAGMWADFGDPSQKGGDLIALYMAHNRVSFPIALERCSEWLGQGTRPEVVYERQRLIAKAKKVERDLGPQKGEWHYTDADGRIIASVYRFEPDAGGKEFLPWDAVNKRHGNPEVRPLYNIPGILQSERVVFCEGEKAAKALIDQGICATAVMGGANSPLDKTDLTPLARKDVLIWPDADEPGRLFAAKLSTALKDVAAHVATLEIPEGKAEGWDAADAADEGLDLESMIGGKADEQPKPILPFFWFSDAAPALDANDFVEGLLTSGTMSVVYGPSNCGKTFFVLDLALHVAQGEPWRGREVDKGAILYLSLEGAQGVRNRISAFRKHHGLEDDQLPFVVMPKPVNLLDSDADVAAVIQLSEYVAAATGLPVRMIIIDTLSRAMAGGNENSSEDMTALINNCDRIRSATAAHVSIVHHSGKDEARGARGHSSLRAATDTEIEIKREAGAPYSSVRIAKQRDLEAGEPFAFTLTCVELGRNTRGKSVVSCVVSEVGEDIPGGDLSALSPKERQAFLCFLEALTGAGTEVADADGEVTMGVFPAAWRVRLEAKKVTNPGNKKSATAEFSRFKKTLISKGFIVEAGDYLVSGNKGNNGE